MSTSIMNKPDADEIQPVLFDVIRADNVEIVKGLLEDFKSLPEPVKVKLQECAIRYGSPSMVDLIAPSDNGSTDERWSASAVQAKNLGTFNHLLSRKKRSGTEWYYYTIVVIAVLESDSEEFFEEWSKFVDLGLKEPERITGPIELYTGVINATAGQIHREQFLLMLWRRHAIKFAGAKFAGDALVHVASSTCSVVLANFLIEHGVPVDFRRSELFLTPLHHAARQNTAAAAKLMKFLLSCGADPEANAKRAKLAIREEKGAMGISKWLGVSWDELVQQVKDQRDGDISKGEL